MGNPNEPGRPAEFAICVEGRVDIAVLQRWLDNVRVCTFEDGATVICAEVADQAALYGLLSRLRDMALRLRSVNLVSVQPFWAGTDGTR